MPVTACSALNNHMPQKNVLSRAPILQCPYSSPVCGTIRTKDDRINRLYTKAQTYLSEPCLWEGLFRIACLIKRKPDEEPVFSRIQMGLAETESGEFSGSVIDQISIARAALSVFEYNTDRLILKRLAAWLRYLEIEFDRLVAQDNILYRPADLMEFLIRYYNITGMKSVLRICTRIRASAFDWTTALHTFQQSIPIRKDEQIDDLPEINCRPEEIDYDTKEKLINHAEMLADGVRYTLFSGLFSGHSQDLSSGRTVWEYLAKHHKAICGGTTGYPFLCGCAPDQPVSNNALAAWTEAFASQMLIKESEWALEELIRIVFNGLSECLNHDEIAGFQRINTIQKSENKQLNMSRLYARMTRAAASAFSHAVTIMEKGIRINYLLPGKYLFMAEKKRVILNIENNAAVFICKESFAATVDFHISRTGNDNVIMKNGDLQSVRKRENNDPPGGFYIRSEKNWNNGDGFTVHLNGNIISEDTHHQGLCFYAGNRLMTVSADEKTYAFAVCQYPVIHEGEVFIGLSETDKWPIRKNEPADIPVLPVCSGKGRTIKMIPYSENLCRITMFPKAAGICMK